MRLDRLRNAEISKRNRERLRNPTAFPSVPTGNPWSGFMCNRRYRGECWELLKDGKSNMRRLSTELLTHYDLKTICPMKFCVAVSKHQLWSEGKLSIESVSAMPLSPSITTCCTGIARSSIMILCSLLLSKCFLSMGHFVATSFALECG